MSKVGGIVKSGGARPCPSISHIAPRPPPRALSLRFVSLQILHGEQYIELHAPLPTEGTVYTNSRVSDFVDKRSGALMIIDAETKDSNGKLLCTNQAAIFINKAGGFGGKSKSEVLKPLGNTPDRSPDRVIESKTNLEQAALYRLNGDQNPLHIDPSFAQIAGQNLKDFPFYTYFFHKKLSVRNQDSGMA